MNILYLESVLTPDLAQQLSDAIRNTDRDVLLRINSMGGSVMGGYQIISSMLNSNYKVYTQIDGSAASIAALIAIVGEKVYMRDFATIMIHNAFVSGNDKPDEKTQNMLDFFNNSLSQIISKRRNISNKKVKDLMNNETWFTSDKALSMKIVDELIPLKQSDLVNIFENNTEPEKIFDIYNQYKNKINNIMEEKEIQEVEVSENVEETVETSEVTDTVETIEEVENAVVEEKIEVIEDISNKVEDVSNIVLEYNNLKNVYEEQIVNIKKLEGDIQNYVAEIENYKKLEAERKDLEIINYIDKAIDEKKINMNMKNSYLTLARVDFTNVKNIIENIVVPIKISEVLNKKDIYNSSLEEKMNKIYLEKNKK